MTDWRKRLWISDARHIADKLGVEAVVVIAFQDGQFASVSYGQTKGKCAEAGKWLDLIAKHMISGKIPAPNL